MDLDRMLEKCRRDQWSLEDLDWTSPPRPMTRDEEMAVVQYLTDMAGIERLAKALFEEQRQRVDDPVLKEIFASFVVDEERHARVAERLARHFDVHHYRDYALNEDLINFRPAFLEALRTFSAEVANAYITTGELILDVALLRSLNDYVADGMFQQAMNLINRDESRHIAIDYHMTGYYASPAYQAWLSAQPARPLRYRLHAWVAFARMLYHARPFLEEVFFKPMDRIDPSQRRLREAMKRVQLVSSRPDVARRPFTRFLRTMQTAYTHPVLRPVLGSVAERILGIPGTWIHDLYTEAEAANVARMSYDELAEEALALKYRG